MQDKSSVEEQYGGSEMLSILIPPSDSLQLLNGAIEPFGFTIVYIKGIVIGDITIENGLASFYIGDTADATTDLVYVWNTLSLEEQEYVEGDLKAKTQKGRF